MMILPDGWTSINQTSKLLNRTYKTVLRWCKELKVPLRQYGFYGRYLSANSLAVVTAHAKTQAVRKKQWDAGDDLNYERRVIRDKELSRRIEAASRWKREHYGAYIGTCEWQQIEQAMK